MDFDLNYLKANLIFTQKSLKNMDKKSQEYRAIRDILYDEIVRKVRIALEKDEKAQEVIEKIKANNKTYFDEYTHPAFQSPCDGEDEIGTSFDGLEYDDYVAHTRGFDRTMAKLLAKKELIMEEPVSKWFFMRKKSEKVQREKLIAVRKEMDNAWERRKYWSKVAKEEELFNKLWVKDGEIVNINEEYEIQLKQLSVPYFHKFAAECLRNNPNLVQYKVDEVSEYAEEGWCPIQNVYHKSTAYKDVLGMIQEIIKEEQIAFVEEVYNADVIQKAEEATKNASKAPKEDTLEID